MRRHLTPLDWKYAWRARRAGVPPGYPTIAIAESRPVRKQVSRALALALLEQESSFRNDFGHDASIFRGAGHVTHEKYAAYKRERGLRGEHGMQGVGPAQLTWWELQDEADRHGGCWKPDVNARVGFAHLAGLIAAHGYARGVARYNGSGPDADKYARDVEKRRQKWHNVLVRGH